MRIFFLAFLLLASCSKSPQTTHFKGWAMTMPYHLILSGNLDEQAQKQVLDIIENTFKEVNEHYNLFNLNSEISKINQAQKNFSTRLTKELATLLSISNKCVQITKGHFDPTIGAVFQAYKESFEKNLPLKHLPDSGWSKIEFDEHQLKKKASSLQIDLNAIAKGYAVDLMIQKIGSLGYKDLYFSWAGDVKAVGLHPENRLWKIQVVFPEIKEEAFLDNLACATSGSFMLLPWKDKDGTSFFHIIDPITKKPMKTTIDTFTYVSVFAPTCAYADALATAALTFPDTKHALRWAREIVQKNPKISFWFFLPKDPKNIVKVGYEKNSFF